MEIINNEVISELNQFFFNKKENIIIQNSEENNPVSPDTVMQMLANFESIGYKFESEDIKKMFSLTEEELVNQIYNPVLEEAKRSRGAHVMHNILFPGFPQTAQDIDIDTLSSMRFVSYFTTALDDYTGYNATEEDSLTKRIMSAMMYQAVEESQNTRDDEYETVYSDNQPVSKKTKITKNSRTIQIKTIQDYKDFIKNILSQNASLSDYDHIAVDYSLDVLGEECIPERVSFTENSAIINAYYFRSNQIDKIDIKTINDYQRLVAALEHPSFYDISERYVRKNHIYNKDQHIYIGNVSLAGKQRFRNFTNQERKRLHQVLRSALINNRGTMLPSMTSPYNKRFIKNILNNRFHFNSPKQFPDNSIYISACAQAANFHGKYYNYETCLANQEYDNAARALSKVSPGALLRHTKTLIDLAYKNNHTEQIKDILDCFAKNVSEMELVPLLTLKSEVLSIKDEYKIYFPKGGELKCKAVVNQEPEWEQAVKDKFSSIIDNAVHENLQYMPSLGKVYIDPVMSKCPIPTIGRTDKGKSRTVMAGTNLPLANKENDILRAVLYKKCRDNGFFDFSAGVLDANFSLVKQISWNNLKENANGKLLGYHSGDGYHCSKGFSEIIDINTSVLKENCPEGKYVVYSAMAWDKKQKISDCEEIFCALEKRPEIEKIPSSKLTGTPLVAQTSQFKIDVTGNKQANIVCIYDIENQTVIPLNFEIDTETPFAGFKARPQNERHFDLSETTVAIENFAGPLAQATYAYTHLHTATIQDLIMANIEARDGTLVDSPEEADICIVPDRPCTDDKKQEKETYTPFDKQDILNTFAPSLAVIKALKPQKTKAVKKEKHKEMPDLDIER